MEEWYDISLLTQDDILGRLDLCVENIKDNLRFHAIIRGYNTVTHDMSHVFDRIKGKVVAFKPSTTPRQVYANRKMNR